MISQRFFYLYLLLTAGVCIEVLTACGTGTSNRLQQEGWLLNRQQLDEIEEKNRL